MKRLMCALLALAMLLTLCSCAAERGETQGVSFTDALGHAVTVDHPERVAVCSGSLAEIWQLAGGRISMVTHDAFEERLFDLPEDAADVGDLKTPSVDAILSQNADLVILSSQIGGHVDLYEVLESAGIQTAYFSVESFDEYLGMLKICTEITGRDDLYETWGTAVQRQVEETLASVAGKEAPTVLFLRAFSSGVKAKGSDSMTGGMLAELGCVNIADSDTSLLDNLSLEAIIKRDPDFIFVTTMGSDDEKAMESLKTTLLDNPAWAELSAVKNGRYVVLPKELYQYKPNARWGEAYQTLAEILYG